MKENVIGAGRMAIRKIGVLTIRIMYPVSKREIEKLSGTKPGPTKVKLEQVLT